MWKTAQNSATPTLVSTLGSDGCHRHDSLLKLDTSVVRRNMENASPSAKGRVSSDVLSTIIAVADDAVITVDGSYLITSFNEGAERIFRRPRSDAVGYPLTILIPDPVAPRHDKLILQFSGSPEVSRRMAERADVLGMRADGSTFPAQISIIKGEPGSSATFAAIVRDVTLERQRERSLIDALGQRELLAAAINASQTSVSISDPRLPDNPLVYVSDGFERATGYTREEAIGSNCRFLQGEGTDPRTVKNIRSAVAEGRDISVVVRNYRKDGTMFWNQLSIAHVRDNTGDVSALVGIQLDVTRERRRYDSVAEAQRLEALGTMAGNIAHEINNWIQPTLVARDLIRLNLPANVDPRVDAHLDRLAESGEHIRTIVRDVLAFARGEQDQSPAVHSDIAAAVSSAVEFVTSSTPPTTTIDLVIETTPHEAANITQTGITQVVTNLCVNAIRAMDGKGKVHLVLADHTVDADDAMRLDIQPGEYFLITVTDTGPGVPLEVRQKIFEPFFSGRRGSVGTGLGLPVVRGILLSWGGNIEVVETDGAGAKFRGYIPKAM